MESSFQSPGSGVWKTSTGIVTPVGAVLPKRCLKCNHHASEATVFELSYIRPSLEIFTQFLPLIGTFIGAANTSHARVTGYLCTTHFIRWQRLKRLGGILMLVWLLPAAACALGDYRVEELVVVSFLFVPVGYLIRGISYPVRATLIQDGYVWIAGCGRSFRENCAPLPPAAF